MPDLEQLEQPYADLKDALEEHLRSMILDKLGPVDALTVITAASARTVSEIVSHMRLADGKPVDLAADLSLRMEVITSFTLVVLRAREEVLRRHLEAQHET